MTPDATPEECRKRGLKDIRDFAFPMEQSDLFAELKRLRDLNRQPQTTRHKLSTGDYIRLWCLPAGPKLDAKLAFRHKVASKCAKAHTQARKTNQH